MLSLTRPDGKRIERFLAGQAPLELSYPHHGATAGAVPDGYDHDQTGIVLGSGDEVFDRGQQALRRWRQFDVGWVEAVPDDTPLLVGAAVAIRAHVMGVWALAACRIVYLIDEAGPPRRFGFAYGTLPDHPEQGEERFVVEQMADGEVRYQIAAFYRPNKLTVRVGWRYFRPLFDRFRRQSCQAMLRCCRDASLGNRGLTPNG